MLEISLCIAKIVAHPYTPFLGGALVETNFNEDKLRGSCGETFLDGRSVFIKLDAIDLGVAWKRAQITPYAISQFVAVALPQLCLPCVSLACYL